MRPFDPDLVRRVPQARLPVLLLGAVGIVQGVATVAAAIALAAVVVAVVRQQAVSTAVIVLLGLIAVRALLAAGAEVLAAWAGQRVSAALRTRLLTRLLTVPAERRPHPSEAFTLAVQGTASVEPWVARFLPSLVHATVVPVVAIAALVVVDPWSALVVVATLPLLPLFAALIGRTTQEATRRRWASLADLSGHFRDVVRGLPTLVSYGRGWTQVQQVERVSDQHRRATLGTLRLAFLSSATLELLATISVALVAVTCGLRLAGGSMDLGTALVAILIAPEAYWPIRRVGQEFHNAADGAEALQRLLALDAETGPSPAHPGDEPGTPEPGAVHVWNVSYTYRGTTTPALEDIDLSATTGLTVLTGPSGVGKSTLLELLAGLRTPTRGHVDSLPAHLVTQQPFLPTGSLSAALGLGNGTATADLWWALRRVALDGFVAGLPDGLSTIIGDDGVGLSAGQRARIAIARATLAPEPLLLLDEPTAHLDPDSADVVHGVIRDLAVSRVVVVVTHRPELVEVADQHVHLARSLKEAPA